MKVKTVTGGKYSYLTLYAAEETPLTQELTQADLIKGVTFEFCVFLDLTWEDVTFDSCNFRHCIFVNCSMLKGKLDNCTIDASTEFVGGRYGDIELVNTDLKHLTHIPTSENFVGYKLVLGSSPQLYNPKDNPYSTWNNRRKGAIYLLELLITGDAVRPVGTNKCRCSSLTVLPNDHLPKDLIYYSGYDLDFIYTPGRKITEEYYNPSDTLCCTAGLHFFLTPQEALDFVPIFSLQFCDLGHKGLDYQHLPEYIKVYADRHSK